MGSEKGTVLVNRKNRMISRPPTLPVATEEVKAEDVLLKNGL